MGAQIIDDYGDEDGQTGNKILKSNNQDQQVNWEKLASWLDEKYPIIKRIIDANNEKGTFADYEVRWDEEREEIIEQYSLRTHFDFRDANIAV